MIWPFARHPVRPAPVTVNHVRYVKVSAIDPRAKAHAMALAMGRHDLAAKLEGFGE